MRERHPLNAPVDFYVERDMRITCCAPVHASLDLMGFFHAPDRSNHQSHCYFKRQPQTDGETQQAINTIRALCCGALRYGGSHRGIIAALVEAGHGDICDNLEGASGEATGHRR
jgi:hypothetical protein